MAFHQTFFSEKHKKAKKKKKKHSEQFSWVNWSDKERLKYLFQPPPALPLFPSPSVPPLSPSQCLDEDM